MSDGNEFQRSDAATGNVRRESRNGGTSRKHPRKSLILLQLPDVVVMCRLVVI